ncbi:hypothetical protein J4E86_009329 [Alternaria arbusti]|uniref:uncharacterized protein n=1 Tax=Alternaria arbusti TaxID=232088 RepID=UPI0022206093|nr:uncharacterized protein J4E86_009329 [Alternaria arbusti]KAI4945442.1 hypothetical protein J4E86_009329 [Alternaria arbusti]
MPSDKQHHRIRGLAALRHLRQGVRSTFSRHPQATLSASGSGPASSINQIRVLHVQPSSIRYRRIECELKLVNLDEAPVYNALSYVWGVDPPKVTIICNGQRLKIRPELSYALVRLRLKETTQIIWADALCINEADDQEKSHQVPPMSKIFSQATQVNVWLGHGDDSVIREAFRCCKLIADACNEFSLKHDINLDGDETHRVVEVPMIIFTPMLSMSLTDLFERPLFSRVWCIQEVKLAQDALVVWGEQCLPWAEVGQAAQWIFDRQFGSDDTNKDLGSSFEEISVMGVDSIYELDPVNCSVLEVLQKFREFQSTDPRDKVYGLIGLSGFQPDRNLMMPDYTKSTAQVFTDTALHTITRNKHLLVFAHVAHHADYDGDDDYRSWAPRWDIPRDTVSIGQGVVVLKSGACSGREAQFVVTKHPEGEQLCLTGIIHAKVTTVDKVFDLESSTKLEGLQMYPEVVEAYKGIDWNNPMSDVALPVLARTLTVDDTTRNSTKLGSESGHARYEEFRRYLEWYRDPKAEFDSLSGDALQCHNQIGILCGGYRFFRTEEKDFGIGPACMREGDVVVVFYGGSAPCVLRPKGDRYLLLGNAYVDSIMNGELVKEVEEGKRQEQEFCLI